MRCLYVLLSCVGVAACSTPAVRATLPASDPGPLGDSATAGDPSDAEADSAPADPGLGPSDETAVGDPVVAGDSHATGDGSGDVDVGADSATGDSAEPCGFDVPAETTPVGANAGCQFPATFRRACDGRLVTSTGVPLGAFVGMYGVITDPEVVFDGSRFRLWFTAMDFWTKVMGTAYAEGSDGRSYDATTFAPADGFHAVTHRLAPASTSAWNGRGIETAAILTMPDVLLEYFTGDVPPPPPATEHTLWQIGAAVSGDDGVSFTELPAPILTPSYLWEGLCPLDVSGPADQICQRNTTPPDECSVQPFGGVLEPTVLWDANAAVFRMWYAAYGCDDDLFAARIAYAESADGATWTKHPVPVLVPGPAGSWDDFLVSHVEVVADPQGGFHMFYFGSSVANQALGGAVKPGAIGHAFSLNGTTWTKDVNNPVIAPRPGFWDAHTVAGPAAIWVGPELRVYYFGAASREANEAGHFEFGYAVASCAHE